MKVEEKLTKNYFRPDKKSHIRLNPEICRGCEKRFCLTVCPANLYKIEEETKEITVEFSGCLECGTCMVSCIRGSISWEYPSGEWGIQYRYG